MFVTVAFKYTESQKGINREQLAAFRYDECGLEIAHFATLIEPESNEWVKSAYGGVTSDYYIAPDPIHALSDFISWLRKSDVLIFWNSADALTFVSYYSKNTSNRFDMPITTLEKPAFLQMESKVNPNTDLNITAQLYGVPENNEIGFYALREAWQMGEIIKRLDYTPAELFVTGSLKELTPQGGKNLPIKHMQEYPVYYSKKDKIVHVDNCPLIVYIEKPGRSNAIKTIPDYEQYERCWMCKEIHKPKAPKKYIQQKIGNYTLLGGANRRIYSHAIVGFCHSPLHPGAVTHAIMCKHKCIEKNCTAFEKTNVPFWNIWYKQEQQKKTAKILNRYDFIQAQRESAEKEKQKKAVEECFAGLGYEAAVIKITANQNGLVADALTVSYVCDCAIPETDDVMSALQDLLKKPCKGLKRMKKPDGADLTVAEYRALKKGQISLN